MCILLLIATTLPRSPSSVVDSIVKAFPLYHGSFIPSSAIAQNAKQQQSLRPLFPSFSFFQESNAIFMTSNIY
jgi:hypothetical protein